MITSIEKKAPIVEQKHDDDDVKIWGFAPDECTIIDLKGEVPFSFDPSFNAKVSATIMNIGYLPKTQLWKKSGVLTHLLKVNPLAHFVGLGYKPSPEELYLKIYK